MNGSGLRVLVPNLQPMTGNVREAALFAVDVRATQRSGWAMASGILSMKKRGALPKDSVVLKVR